MPASVRYQSRALGTCKREYLMIIVLFLNKTICCDPSSEPSHGDDLDEGSQHKFLCRAVIDIYDIDESI